jgi:hypothetical protein
VVPPSRGGDGGCSGTAANRVLLGVAPNKVAAPIVAPKPALDVVDPNVVA